jgi:hypothetical protein
VGEDSGADEAGGASEDYVDHEGWWCWWSLSWNETGDSEVVREGSC